MFPFRISFYKHKNIHIFFCFYIFHVIWISNSSNSFKFFKRLKLHTIFISPSFSLASDDRDFKPMTQLAFVMRELKHVSDTRWTSWLFDIYVCLIFHSRLLYFPLFSFFLSLLFVWWMKNMDFSLWEMFCVNENVKLAFVRKIWCRRNFFTS